MPKRLKLSSVLNYIYEEFGITYVEDVEHFSFKELMIYIEDAYEKLEAEI